MLHELVHKNFQKKISKNFLKKEVKTILKILGPTETKRRRKTTDTIVP
jgi:hypothetical protein